MGLDCWNIYGVRYPTSNEWYIAINNYALTDEIDDYEWASDGHDGGKHVIVGSGSITTHSSSADSTARAYRCFIPK